MNNLPFMNSNNNVLVENITPDTHTWDNTNDNSVVFDDFYVFFESMNQLDHIKDYHFEVKSIPIRSSSKAVITSINKTRNCKLSSLDPIQYQLYYEIKKKFEAVPFMFSNALNQGNPQMTRQVFESCVDTNCHVKFQLQIGLYKQSNGIDFLNSVMELSFQVFPDSIHTVSNVTFDFDEEFTTLTWISHRAATIVNPWALLECLMFSDAGNQSRNNESLLQVFKNYIFPGGNKLLKFTTCIKIRCIIDNKKKVMVDILGTFEKVNKWIETVE